MDSLNIGAAALGVVFSATALADGPRPFVSTFMSVPMLTIDVTAPEEEEGTDARSVEYSPNTNPDVGLAVDYGPFGVSFSVPLKSPSNADGEDGEKDEAPDSRYWDTKLSYSVWLFHLEAGAHRYQGFNYSSSDPDRVLGDAPGENDPDLVKRGRFANFFYYPLGGDFDIGRRVDEAKHEGFRWSPLVQAFYERTELRSSSAIVPERYEEDFGRDAGLSDLKVEAYGLAAGGAVKYGEKDWQADLAMTFGRSLDYQELVMATGGSEARRRMGEKMSLRVGGDYFTVGWNIALAMMLDQASTPLSEGELSSQLGMVQVSAGFLL